MSDHNQFDLLDVQDAARFLGLSKSTLDKRRCNGTGPVYVKQGRRVGYLRTDLEAYLQQNRCHSTQDYPTARRQPGTRPR